MKKILVFIEHDIIIRHFILGRALRGLEDAYDVTYVFPEKDKRVTIDVASLGLKSVRFLPTARARTSRLTQLAQVKTIQRSWFNPSFKQIRIAYQGVFDPKTYRKMVFWSLPGIYELFRRKVFREISRFSELDALVAELRPTILLHPTILHGLFMADLALASEETGIPFVALMNSWDNPSTKAQVFRNPDWLAVWGEQTRNHAVEFMKMKRERIEILGAAQFDAYNNPPRKSRDQILTELGLGPSILFIVFAGSSKGVNEMEQLLALDEAIEKGELPRAKVVFRPHPWRDPSHETRDFFDIPWQNVVMDPSMRSNYIGPNKSGQGVIHLTDYADTHSILSACDLLIGNVSTILLEAALHGKPVVSFINDNDTQNKTSHFTAVLNQRYFRELLSGLEIPLCRTVEDLVQNVRRLSAHAGDPIFAKSQKIRARFSQIRMEDSMRIA